MTCVIFTRDRAITPSETYTEVKQLIDDAHAGVEEGKLAYPVFIEVHGRTQGSLGNVPILINLNDIRRVEYE